MADQKATALSAFTPVLSDILYGVDDPGGTPVSGKVTLTAVRDLLQANLTTADASTGYDINSEVSLRSGGANILEQRNGANAQTFNIYNTFTDASNYERGGFKWNANVLEVFTEAGGTGTLRGIDIAVGASKYLFRSSQLTMPGGLLTKGSVLGFFNTGPVSQQATTGTTAGFTAGAGTGVNDDSTFTGNSGTAAYTIGDIVLAMKNYGLLAAS